MKRDVKLFDCYNRPDDVFEAMNPESIVETAGYLPADVQISTMIDAGRRLGEARKEMYDYFDGEEEGFDQVDVPPDRVPGADLADASQISMAVNARLEAQAREIMSEAEKIDSSPPVEPVKGD